MHVSPLLIVRSRAYVYMSQRSELIFCMLEYVPQFAPAPPQVFELQAWL